MKRRITDNRYAFRWVLQISMILLFVLTKPDNANAQEEMCCTHSDYPDALMTLANTLPCYPSITEPFYLRIGINLIRRTDGSCDRTLYDVYEALNLLQEPFAVHGIYFRLECIRFLDDDNLYNQTSTVAQYCVDGQPYPNSCTYPNFPDLFFDNAITVFVYPKGIVSDYEHGCGFASGIPGNGLMIKGFWRSTEIDSNGNTISEQFIDLFKSGILAHEMGHCLGLFNTFHGLCDEDGCAETVTPESDPLNPCVCGDYVADTPADPGIADSLVDDETCELIILGRCIETISPGYHPLTDNLMSY